MGNELGNIIPTRSVTDEQLSKIKSGEKKDLGEGVDSNCVLDAISKDEWTVRVPIERRWGWRTIAFKLAFKLWMLRLQHQQMHGKEVKQIDGWNGDARIHLILYIKVPKHFNDARRQNAIMGLESASSHQGRLQNTPPPSQKSLRAPLQAFIWDSCGASILHTRL